MSRKTDAKGRRRHRREAVERLLHAYDAAGLSQAGFAKKNRIALTTLQYWLRRRREQGSDPKPRKPALVPVTLRPRAGAVGGQLEVVLTNGRELRLPVDTDVERVTSLVAALES